MEALDAVLPVYVDYLGCFDREDNIQTPPDVMKELHERGVQENCFLPYGELSLDEDQLVLRDSPGRVAAERFNLKTIHSPVAFMRRKGDLSTDGFSRVVIFTESKAGHFKSNDVFHAFQCCDSDPTELVEMIHDAKARLEMPAEKMSRQISSTSVITQNSLDSNWIMGPRIEMRHNYGDIQNGTDSVRSATIRRGNARNSANTPLSHVFDESMNGGQHKVIPVPVPTPPKQRERKHTVPLVTAQTAETLGFERPSFQYTTSEDPIQRDTILLNYCIGDIELFCAEIRATHLPPEIAHVRRGDLQAIEFVGIFQKFKLAFNLLARLDGFIQDPSALDLLHHLFPPLAFLVDECYDLFEEDLVRDVVCPLPTPKAVEMLDRCLGQREAVIWRALGDNWLNPKAKNPAKLVPYQPRFQDGWSPGTISFHEEVREEHSVVLRTRGGKDVASNDRQRKTSSRLSDDFSGSSEDNNFHRMSTSSGTGAQMQDVFRDELMERGVEIALVTHSREGQNARELSVFKGEYLEIVDASKNWWRVINVLGQSGFVPCTLMKVIYYEDGEQRRKSGQFEQSSKNYERKHSKKSSRKSSSSSNSSQNGFVRNSPAPPPVIPSAPAPPPMPPQIKVDAPAIRVTKGENSLTNCSMRSGQSMHEELKSVLDLFREKEKHLEIMTTPDVFITQNSRPHEVHNWLKAKQFSKRVLDQLSRLDGDKLFSMTRTDLIKAFGKEEGSRLDSQITISRKTTGFQTARSSELRNILAKARERTENDEAEGEEIENHQSRA